MVACWVRVRRGVCAGGGTAGWMGVLVAEWYRQLASIQ